MGYRIFRDSQGTEWQTWDVVPRGVERRVTERRNRVGEPQETDRRATPTRRVNAGHRPALTWGMNEGWLCFEARDEKRRLQPIPSDWERCPREELERYCSSAQPARRTSSETAVPG